MAADGSHHLHPLREWLLGFGRAPNRPLLIALAFVVLVGPWLRPFLEQMQWRSKGYLTAEGIEYAPEGIVVHITARAEIIKVLRQRDGWPMLFAPSHYSSGFYEIVEDAGRVTLLVRYRFEAGREWLLAVKSADGDWWEADPDFPDDGPGLSQQEWDRLIARSTQVGAFERSW
ncbi:MAG TPA: hypothetical protein DGT21_22390 [Armatimonadetes bacterium]|jgi:hypothetical protein|nr:hypothetical protein [Armatimonadota bacterium]